MVHSVVTLNDINMPKPEDVAALTNEANGDAKKKKKRSRKKKAKKGGDDRSTTSSNDDRQPVEQAPQVPTTAAMNPHAILRDRLMAAGFSVHQIDRAMEEMWDKNLAYDEFDAVLKYLKREKDEKKEEHKEEAIRPSSNEKDEVKSITPVVVGSGKEETKEIEETEDKPTMKSAPPMTMEQKLETVAGFENLTDATFALTEWINKAAKPRDVSKISCWNASFGHSYYCNDDNLLFFVAARRSLCHHQNRCSGYNLSTIDHRIHRSVAFQ